MVTDDKTYEVDVPLGDDGHAPDHDHPVGPDAPVQPLHPHDIPDELPLLSTGDSVMFPALVVPITLLPSDNPATKASVRAIEAAAGSHSKLIALVAQRSPQADSDKDGGPEDAKTPDAPSADAPAPDAPSADAPDAAAPAGPTPSAAVPDGTTEEVQESPLAEVGVVSRVVRLVILPGGGLQALLQGVQRARLVPSPNLGDDPDPFPRVAVTLLQEELGAEDLEPLRNEVLRSFRELIAASEGLPEEIGVAAGTIESPSEFSDFVAANSPIKPADRQEILETLHVGERLRRQLSLLIRAAEVVKVGAEIRESVQRETDKRQREFILREQLRAIQRELGEGDDGEDLADLRKRLAEAGLSDVARKEADKELGRLSTINAMSPEYNSTRTYLEWIADLPWGISTPDKIDIDAASAVLDEDHFDLEKVKERILDYLAVRKLRADARGPILCFIGPPGVGKTSLGQSIARAIGREFVRLSLGGVRDEASIRGFRRTYVGALPGRIIQELKRVGTNNPVFMLDEVDKLGADAFRGDPASALLEVLDPAQNHAFTDHYLDLPFDLSPIMFICTANQADPIPRALLDRMEVIQIPSYTRRDKVEIARRYLVPRQIEEKGLPKGALTLPDDTLAEIANGYTREAGVRQLERQIGGVARWVARRVARGETAAVTVAPGQLEEILGPAPFRDDIHDRQDEVGVATGLAATAIGGDVLYVEAATTPGKGKLTLTGQLGEVMRESATAALTYARARSDLLSLPPDFFDTHDLHIHVPAGGIPKEGPSAGVTLATAIVSAATGRKIRKSVAMTGEISLHGRVLPIGGLKEKTLAAHRAGIREIIIPKENEPDWREVPEDVRAEMTLHLVESLDEVLKLALYAPTIDAPVSVIG